MTVLDDVPFLVYQQQKAVVKSFRLHFLKIDTNRQSMKVSTQEKKHPNFLLLYVPQRDY